MPRRFRRSLAARLIAGGCVLALVVVGGVAAYLIYSRTAQTTAAAQSNADNRAGVMSQVLDRFTGAEALSAADSLARQQPLRDALRAPDPAIAVSALFAGGASPDVVGETLVVTDGRGRIVYDHASPSIGASTVEARAPLAVATALHGGSCARSDGVPTAGGCGVEILASGAPVYVAALPVVDGAVTVGAVAYVAPLSFQLGRFQSLFGFPTAFIAASQTGFELRPPPGQSSQTDAGLRASLGRPGALHHAVYDAPTPGGGVASVAGSFTPLDGPNHEVTGFIGIEVPLSQFVGDERTDVFVLALIAVFVLLLVVITVALFVDHFVKRPIATLESGVARIAGGDYSTDIAVGSHDEIGRLAGNVNRMRGAIAGYVREIEEARDRLDTALERVSGVSRALTTTTSGVPSLQDAVVRTAALIAGEPASAVLALRNGDELVSAATAGDPPPLADFAGLEAVLHGQTVRLEHRRHGALLAVTMFYQNQAVGALVVVRSTTVMQRGDIDVDVLTVLANNAAIAMENARLFEQERETVHRLLELDSLKTDFLGTVQHELRTPLTAILGLADLLEMCWGMWDDEPKLEAVRDIQMAANNLHDIIETIIDYSRMEEQALSIAPSPVLVREAVDGAITVLAERYKGGLPVPIEVSGDDTLAVAADPDHLAKVLRALLDNAVKFSDGRGRVRVEVSPGLGTAVSIVVRDEGIGIAGDDLPRVFDRFFQVDNTATRKYGGAGMGLAMARRVVEAHRGRVEVDSVLGRGTRVVVTWPAPGAGGADEAASDPDRTLLREPALPVQ